MMMMMTRTSTLVHRPRFPGHRLRPTPGLHRHDTTTTVGGCGEISEEQSGSRASPKATFDGAEEGCREGVGTGRAETDTHRCVGGEGGAEG